jgi:hypothetical protein
VGTACLEMVRIMAIDIQTLMPSNTPSYMFPAWAGCISWAASDQATIDAFAKANGIRVPPLAKSPLDEMIDAACGIDREGIARKFVAWVNDNIWGDPFAEEVPS